MRTETTRDPTTPYVLQHATSLAEAIEPPTSRRELPPRRSGPPPAHDATLLVRALEDLEVQRVAIEWLLDADLLCVCLV